MASPAARLPFWSFFSFFGSPSPAGLQLAGCWELQISSSGSQKGAVCWARLLLLEGFLRVFVKKIGEKVALLPQLRKTKQKNLILCPLLTACQACVLLHSLFWQAATPCRGAFLLVVPRNKLVAPAPRCQKGFGLGLWAWASHPSSLLTLPLSHRPWTSHPHAATCSPTSCRTAAGRT